MVRWVGLLTAAAAAVTAAAAAAAGVVEAAGLARALALLEEPDGLCLPRYRLALNSRHKG